MQPGTSFGRILKDRRRMLDMTQESLARQVGCAVVTIKKIEADTLRPSRQIAELLAEALQISTDERAGFVRLARATPRPDGAVSPPQTPPSPVAERDQVDNVRGRAIKGYTLGERLGAGGFGAVYRAQQTGVGRDVAIKIILPHYANQPEFIRRFEAEAHLVARLEHPHIVPLYDYWRESDGAYLVMRYMRGGSLHTLISAGSMTFDTCIRVLDQITAALTVAHRAGVIHRDLKPANILLDDDGNAYLADFGIAKELGTTTPDEQTQANVIVGSPAYLSPEQIRDEPATPQTDIYSLGILLYEMLTGAPPFPKLPPGDLLQKQLHEPLPPLAERRPDLPGELNTVIQRATAKRPTDRYGDVSGFAVAVRRAVASGNGAAPTKLEAAAIAAAHIGEAQEHTSITSARATPDQETALLSALLDTVVAPVENPYKGLRAFAEADAADFFGRAALVERVLERLAEEGVQARFLAIVGPSGSGKSSVAKAGVIPALRRGGLPGSEQWFVADILPGAHPLEEIEAALLRVAVNPPASLLAQLREDERGLLRAVKRVLPADDSTELVFVIDQFEELFTLVEDEETRAHLLASLAAAVADPRSRVRVIVTLRADFYDRPLLYAGVGELMRERSEVILPLTPDELEQAILSPAERAGLQLEPGLVTVIVKDVSEQPGALPLLQYALTELFERRVGRLLTLDAYRASGGVLGALARRADELYAGLDTDAQETARQLFLRLVTLGEGVEDTRRRVRREELVTTRDMQRAMTESDPARAPSGPDVSTVLDSVISLYGRYRLLTFDRDPITRGPTVEVAHEALIRTWGRLRAWLDASRADLRVQRRLAAEATEWINTERDASFLASGARLAQFEALVADSDLSLNEQETAYVRASIVERERQEIAERARQARELELAHQSEASQRRAANRLRYLVIGLAVFLLVAIGLSVFAFNRQAAAVTNLTRSEAQRLAAEANTLLQAHGNTEVIALLSIRSIITEYSPQGDAALAGAALLDYPVQQFNGQTQLVLDVAFSPDGKYVLTGSGDKIARLSDAKTGQLLRQFTGHNDLVTSVAFSPDGRKILTGSVDGTARLWDTTTGQELRQFVGHEGSVDTVAFSPDGQRVFTGSIRDKTARLWDAQTGQELRVFSGHTDGVYVLAVSPDGKHLLTGSNDKTARLWDVQSGQQLLVFSGHTREIQGVAISPDGKCVLTGSLDKTVRLWDAQTGKEVRQLIGHTDGLRHVTFSHDGKHILTGSNDATVRLWDVQTGKELRRFIGHKSDVFSVAFSPDDKYALSGSLDNTALLWDVQARAEYPQFVHSDAAYAAFSPDGKSVVTGSWDTTVRLWNAQTGEQRWSMITTEPLNTVAFSPDGRYVLTGSVDKTARLWDAQTGQELHQFVGHRTYLNSVAFSPDGKYVLTGSGDREARLWDVQTGKEVRQLIGHTFDNVFSVAFSPDSNTAVTGSYDGTARLWDVQTGKELRRFTIPNDGAAAVTFSSDGKYILTGSWDGVARLWDAQTGAQVRRFVGHTDIIWGVAFSLDGKYVLTGSQDKTARLWDAQTGQELRRFTGHTAIVNTVAFSPDGRRVLTGSTDGTARLWDVDYHDTIRYLCGRLLRDFSDDERAQYNIPNDGPTCPKP